MEFDFSRYNQGDLLDLWRGRMTWRKVAGAIAILDRIPESAYWRARNESDEWTLANYQLANLTDLLQGANWQRAGDRNAPRPEPVMRPADMRKAAEQADKNLANALAMRARNRRRGIA